MHNYNYVAGPHLSTNFAHFWEKTFRPATIYIYTYLYGCRPGPPANPRYVSIHRRIHIYTTYTFYILHLELHKSILQVQIHLHFTSFHMFHFLIISTCHSSSHHTTGCWSTMDPEVGRLPSSNSTGGKSRSWRFIARLSPQGNSQLPCLITKGYIEKSPFDLGRCFLEDTQSWKFVLHIFPMSKSLCWIWSTFDWSAHRHEQVIRPPKFGFMETTLNTAISRRSPSRAHQIVVSISVGIVLFVYVRLYPHIQYVFHSIVGCKSHMWWLIIYIPRKIPIVSRYVSLIVKPWYIPWHVPSHDMFHVTWKAVWFLLIIDRSKYPHYGWF